MNMMAAGMFPVMIFLMMGRDMRADGPAAPQFWAVMSLGVTVGSSSPTAVNGVDGRPQPQTGLMTARPHPAPPHAVPRLPAEALS
jgi:hypothetical protein